MAKTKYTYNITDFSNNKADAGKLYNTILESPDFTCMVDSINISADDVDIWFRASITPAEWATLSGIVAVHDGEEYTEEKPTIDQGMYGKNTAGSWVPMQFSSEGRILVDVQTTAGQHGNDSHTSEFITVSGVTFEALDANEDVGTAADQVAQGNHLHDDRYYTETEIDNFSFLTTISGGAHDELTNLDYASSGHTGFSPTIHTHTESDITDLQDYVTETEFTTYSGTLQDQIDGKSDLGHMHDDRYYTENEVDTLISGSASSGVFSHVQLTFYHDTSNPYAKIDSANYSVLNDFLYQAPETQYNTVKFVIKAEDINKDHYGSVQVYDITNNNQIIEFTYGVIHDWAIVTASGFVNVPSSEAIFEIRTKELGTSKTPGHLTYMLFY